MDPSTDPESLRLLADSVRTTMTAHSGAKLDAGERSRVVLSPNPGTTKALEAIRDIRCAVYLGRSLGTPLITEI